MPRGGAGAGLVDGRQPIPRRLFNQQYGGLLVLMGGFVLGSGDSPSTYDSLCENHESIPHVYTMQGIDQDTYRGKGEVAPC